MLLIDTTNPRVWGNMTHLANSSAFFPLAFDAVSSYVVKRPRRPSPLLEAAFETFTIRHRLNAFAMWGIRPTYLDSLFRNAPTPSKIRDLRWEGRFFTGVLRNVFIDDGTI
jgi:hypothetical protein